MKQNWLVLLFIIFGFSSGCASKLIELKPNCSELNWFEKGRQDGMQGQPSNNWTMKSSVCETMEKKQIADYIDGWNHGLSLYCTKEHGFSIAKSGIAYKKICPENYENDFIKGFDEGVKVFVIEKETAQIIAQVESLESDLRNNNLTDLDKVRLEQNISNLNRKKLSNLKVLEQYNQTLTR